MSTVPELAPRYHYDVNHKCYTVNVQLTAVDRSTEYDLVENPICKALGTLVFWIVTVNFVEIL